MLFWTLRNLKSKDSQVRKRAAEKLGDSGSSRAVEPLIEMLEDFDPAARNSAAAALVKIGGMAALIAALDHQPGAKGAAEALGNMKDARAVDALITAVESKPWVCSKAAWALGEIGDQKAIEPLIAALKNKSIYLASAAAAALGKIGDARAVEPLIAALREGLLSLGAAISGRASETGTIWDLCSHAAWALGQIPDPRAVDPLIVALDRGLRSEAGGAWGLRSNAAWALGQISDPRAADSLLAAMNVPDANLRFRAAESLGRIKDTRAVEPLIAKLHHPAQDVRKDAAEALGLIGDVRAIGPLLAAMMESEADAMRPLHLTGEASTNLSLRGKEALKRICRATFERQLAALTNQNPDVRRTAAEFCRGALRPLVDAIDSRDPRLRAIAYDVLGDTTPWEAAKALRGESDG